MPIKSATNIFPLAAVACNEGALAVLSVPRSENVAYAQQKCGFKNLESPPRMSYLAAWPEFFFGLTGVLLLLQSLGFMPLGNFHFLRHIGHGSGTDRAGVFFYNKGRWQAFQP